MRYITIALTKGRLAKKTLELFDRFGITAMVTKDSGAAGGFPQKVEACRARNITCIVIARPVETDEGVSPDEAYSKIMQIRSSL